MFRNDANTTQSAGPVLKLSRVAIYRGSFDPPHYGHQQLVQYCLSQEHCDKVYVLILNQAYFDQKPNRSDYLSRMGMLDISFKGNLQVDVSDESQPQLVARLREENPGVYIIKPMGDDKFVPKFDASRAEEMPAPDEWLVFPREAKVPLDLPPAINGVRIRQVVSPNFTLNDYSSTQVRTFMATHDDFFDGEVAAEEKLPLNQAMRDYIRKRNLYRKPTAIDVIDELKANTNAIRAAYHLTGELYFRQLKGGICNAPAYVYQREGDKEIPIGVFKLEVESYEVAKARFTMLNEMTANGFAQNPQVYRNRSGDFLTRVGKRHYSLMEFIVSDPDHPENDLRFQDMLMLADQFHAASQQVSEYPGLRMIRYELHMSRQKILDEVDKLGVPETLLKSSEWARMACLYRYCATAEARAIFDALPKQIINGDHQQSNLVYRNGVPYFIDLDSRRYDLRLYDITGIVRGGSQLIRDTFWKLAGTGQLSKVLAQHYGQTAAPLTALELREFPLVLAFAFVEFFSWVLNRVKQEGPKAEFMQYMTQKLAGLTALLDSQLLDESRFGAAAVTPLRRHSIYAIPAASLVPEAKQNEVVVPSAEARLR